MELFQRGWKIKQKKKSIISDTLLKKVNSNSLFYLMILQKHYIFSIFYIESIR